MESNISELSIRHEKLMTNKNILISVYNNASGFLWSAMMVDSGTDLGWSEYSGDCEMSGTFTTYNKAFKHALDLLELTKLTEYENNVSNDKFHWSNFVDWIKRNKKK